MNNYLALPRKDPALAAAAIVAAIGLLTICGFFFFQYVMKLPPCPICLEERNAYYVSVPLAALLMLGASYGASRKVLLLGFLVIAAVMLWNTGLAAYHAGIEWKFWPGPQDCSGAVVQLNSGSLLDQMNRTRVIRCDEAAWRLFGISLAGYNAIIAAALTLFALRMAYRK